MFTDHQLKWKPMIIVGTLIAILAWCVVLLVTGTKFAHLLPALTKFGVVVLVMWGAWLLFTNRGWRWRLLRFGRLLVATPDLNGRWVGKSVSNYDKKERPMTLEIRQTLLRIQCSAFGPQNVAQGYSARILADGDEHTFKLAYLYHAKRQVVASVPGDEHEGVALLTVIEGTPRRLRGFYMNDRDPDPRKADIELAWESSTLKGEL